MKRLYDPPSLAVEFSAPSDGGIIRHPILVVEDSEVDALILKYLHIEVRERDLSRWEELIHRVYNPRDEVKIAIVGRPNVGKSSIINSLTSSERVIVTPIAGTTRDAVDVPFEVETEGVRQNYILIDRLIDQHISILIESNIQ